jgi:TPR repeat protein
MYYAGRCVPRDLPTAYHWYALALHAEPDNSQVSAQLEAIWKQMSPAERQLALKSQ